jgi:outer membrane protein assembly factor BamB
MTTGKELWRTKASPCKAVTSWSLNGYGGVIVLAMHGYATCGSRAYIQAFDANTGQALWTYIPTHRMSLRNPDILAGVFAIRGSAVVLADISGNVCKLDLETGRQVWTREAMLDKDETFIVANVSINLNRSRSSANASANVSVNSSAKFSVNVSANNSAKSHGNVSANVSANSSGAGTQRHRGKVEQWKTHHAGKGNSKSETREQHEGTDAGKVEQEENGNISGKQAFVDQKETNGNKSSHNADNQGFRGNEAHDAEDQAEISRAKGSHKKGNQTGDKHIGDEELLSHVSNEAHDDIMLEESDNDATYQVNSVNLRDDSEYDDISVMASAAGSGAVVGPGEVIFVTSNPVNSSTGVRKGRLEALNLTTGERLWQVNLDSKITNGPAVGLLHPGGQGSLSVLITISGELDVSDIKSSPKLPSKHRQRILLSGPTHPTKLAKIHQGKLIAFEALTGTLKTWTYEQSPWKETPTCWKEQSQAFSNPTIAGDGTVYVGSGNGLLYAIRDHDGDGFVNVTSEVTSYRIGKAFGSSPCIAPGILIAAPCNGILAFKSF